MNVWMDEWQDAWLFDEFVAKPEREREYVGRMVWFSKGELATRYVESKDFYKQPEVDMAGSHGFRRPVIGMATAVLAAFGAGQIPGAKVVEVKRPVRRERHKLFKSNNHRPGNWKKPHQGAQECARRVRQAEAGQLTPNYVHGRQYLT